LDVDGAALQSELACVDAQGAEGAIAILERVGLALTGQDGQHDERTL
jgi:hypothetical protein